MLPQWDDKDLDALRSDSRALCHVPGSDDYYVSPLLSENQHTEGCYRCVALVIAGIDRETHERVVRICHLSGVILLPRSGFADLFPRGLGHLNERLEEEGRFAGIAGGFIGEGQNPHGVSFEDEYRSMVAAITDLVQKHLHVDVEILADPKSTPDAPTHVYYRLPERRVIVCQAEPQAVLVSAG